MLNDEPKEWWTLEDYAVSLFKANKTDTPEFQLLLRMFGRDRLAEMWERYKNKKKIAEERTSKVKPLPGGDNDGGNQV